MRARRHEAGAFRFPIHPSIAEVLLEDERFENHKYHDLVESADEAEQQRLSQHVGLAFTEASTKHDVVSTLGRYEATLERAFYKALHELQRLQADRKGTVSSAPARVDVEITR